MNSLGRSLHKQEFLRQQISRSTTYLFPGARNHSGEKKLMGMFLGKKLMLDNVCGKRPMGMFVGKKLIEMFATCHLKIKFKLHANNYIRYGLALCSKVCEGHEHGWLSAISICNTKHLQLCIVRLTKSKMEKLRRYSLGNMDGVFNLAYWSYNKSAIHQSFLAFSDSQEEEMAVRMYNSMLELEGPGETG